MVCCASSSHLFLCLGNLLRLTPTFQVSDNVFFGIRQGLTPIAWRHPLDERFTGTVRFGTSRTQLSSTILGGGCLPPLGYN